MSQAALQAAVRLFRSDSQQETYLAVAVVGAVVLPVVWSYYSNTRGDAMR